MSNIQHVDVLIGRAVISVESANKLGQVHDLLVHPTTGEMVGLSIQVSEQNHFLVSKEEIRSIGPDAVMIEREESLVPADQSQLKAFPLAKNSLVGVKVVTEDGKLLGEIANVYFYPEETRSLFIYEVRSSLLDKLLGHSLYFSASLGCAFSNDGSRLVVANATENADHKLQTIESRIFSPSGSYTPEVSVRSVHSSELI